MTTSHPLSASHADDAMAALLGGFDGASAPDSRRQQALWCVGRWLRAQGSGRPRTLYRADDGVLIVNSQILTMDAHGQIQNLSTTRRSGAPASRIEGRVS